ncbi:DUF669 domain-containing protein [Streptococcus dysgalactiae]|uniref:Phage protein n=1 Tax=Streptococcus dysgalactiae subsp. equisimilis TaxID=119602 RepID=A0A9X8SXZ3_STREQ|nr:DUF669 domain-containing protein [Streptococcus dysgalactiae]SQF66314.1 phage protein [Streptococcus dysgalactiae subsp. equisimilis]VEF04376.1 phage protein [Streptococcus dysgalactiae subsp. equisimilis]
MFTIDYSKAKEFASITDGTYETFIEKAVQDATKNGADFINIHFRIRKDFQQEFQNNIIFHRIFAKKEDGKYPEGVIHNLAKQAGIPEGTQFKSLDDYLNQLLNKCLKITVKNETSEYNGNTYNNLNVKRIEKSDIPAMVNPVEEFKEDDLPF